MASWPAPGPWIVRSLVSSSSPVVSVIVGVGGGVGGGGGEVGLPLPLPLFVPLAEVFSRGALNVVVELDVVVELVSVEAKTMVSPLWAASIWAQSEPAPLSSMLVTVSVLKRQRSSSVSSRGKKPARWRGGVCVCRRAAGAERFEFRGQE